MERYIGIDVHANSTTMCVLSERGRKLQTTVMQTHAATLIESVRAVPRRRCLCLEESTHSTWLFEVLRPHVDEIVVTQMRASRGHKSDEIDASKLANALRLGDVQPVFKDRGTLSKLHELADTYMAVTQDTTRIKNRIKALYRSRGVSTAGKALYSAASREEYLDCLPAAYRPAAHLLYQQLDAVQQVKNEAQRQLLSESHKHAISRVLETCPGMGPVRVALLLPVVISPHRFRTSRQLWAYSGLAVVMRSSADWVQSDHGWQRTNIAQTRGLNRNFNRRLKYIFKGAASGVISAKSEPLYGDYIRLTQQGTKPPLAKLTLARRIAATTLAMWKTGEVYDPERARAQSA